MVLNNKSIQYDPPIEELAPESEKISIRNSVVGWIGDYI